MGLTQPPPRQARRTCESTSYCKTHTLFCKTLSSSITSLNNFATQKMLNTTKLHYLTSNHNSLCRHDNFLKIVELFHRARVGTEPSEKHLRNLPRKVSVQDSPGSVTPRRSLSKVQTVTFSHACAQLFRILKKKHIVL